MAEVIVPALGDSVTSATVSKIIKNVGDVVKADELLIELETDKVNLEVNAPKGGTISEIKIKQGDTVAVGAILLIIDESGAQVAPAKAEAPKVEAPKETKVEAPKEAPASPAPVDLPAASEMKEAAPNAVDGEKYSPAVQKFLDENSLDASKIIGTGKDGRLSKADVTNYLEGMKSAGGSAAISTPSAVSLGGGEPNRSTNKVMMSKLRQTIATRLKDAQNNAAILTTFNEIDMTKVIELRNIYKDTFEKKHGVKLGFMSFFVKAVLAALKDIPALNAQIVGNEMVYHNYYDIGVAVGAPQGLVVPVLRNVEAMSLADIEKTIGEFGAQAKEGKLALSSLMGGTFTISNGGVYGSLLSTPILNPPQSGILGMHKMEKRPVVINDEIVIRTMMYVALSYDHRIVDGKEAVTFLVKVKENIEEPSRMLLEI